MLSKLSCFSFSVAIASNWKSQTDVFHRSIVTDYIFAKDRLFAYINLDEKELHLYDQLYTILSKEITKPDLVIYLQADTDRLMKNIDLRDRDYERDMDRDYIDSLNQFYNQFFFSFDADIDILEVRVKIEVRALCRKFRLAAVDL